MPDSPDQNVFNFDPHFKIFHDLMAFKVREILLVSSPYDAFIMEEDGSIANRIINEYQGLNLSGAPRITRASSASDALDIVGRQEFDLVISMPHLGGMDGFALGSAIKKIRPTLPVILLTHNLRSVYPLPEGIDCQDIDDIYWWCCESDLLLAIIKNIEDRVNVDHDTRRAMVRVILFVEDSPQYRSAILPMLYKEMVRQTQAVLDDSLNTEHRLLRMRARPKILTAINYEEAMVLYDLYKPYIFGIISDVRFPRRNRVDKEAGFRFMEQVRAEAEDMPLLMLSSEPENRHRAEQLPAVFLDKTSAALPDQLHDFFLEYLGFGDFVFHLPGGEVVGRAANFYELEQALQTVPVEILSYHAHCNHFFNWTMARSEVALAARLHRDRIKETTDGEVLREDLVGKIHAQRKLRQRGVVARFSPASYQPEIMDFVKIGEGSIGGKGRGIAFMWASLQQLRGGDFNPTQQRVTIPRTCVIASSGFDDFVTKNHLHEVDGVPDEEVAELFLAARLPKWLRDQLRHYLSHIDFPLSIRSSSLLEDAQFKPYAGLYSTYFLPNNHPDFEVRFRQLEEAVKLVYASTWFESPRAFSRSVSQGSKDAMAVLIQELAGSRYGDFYYPAISGVAQSHNYYPVMGMRAEDGIAHIALGVGKTVVEGEKSLRFSPSQPKRLVQFSMVDDILANCQRQFYALDMTRSEHLVRQGSNLVKREIQDAEAEAPVHALASTYVADEDRIRDAALPGMKVLTFAQILKYNLYPLPAIITRLLALGRDGMGCEIEMEFAVCLNQDPAKSVFYFLQLRPMVAGEERFDVNICDRERSQSFCRSSESLGHGRFDEMADIVHVRPEAFDPAATKQIAIEIGAINQKLESAGRPYLLIGPGRWGSADPWLGIPVQWRDISGVGAIIELRNAQLRADPSQGSHFFQNITSLGIPYLTVDESGTGTKDEGGLQDRLDWSWIADQEVIEESPYVRHVRQAMPFVLKCNGQDAEAVIYEEASSCMLDSSD
ncbi:MAG: phosphoenolpyruvate synthase/pyruvate phosphate dikinase [Desulfobulbaceae bacterium]|uniref:Phosphoenolpyruvate synthase/pyruvate phosphate dikinase n=1 Tax=Candidatus Desulfatifera sulfidica TaxID=2841691 RepID=A0A8J6NB02_9BACT|nr:phosphoenolpyruvate synthase/pyruvate phosphate dikinase [Candidatus Desulfatifera sulfidica]